MFILLSPRSFLIKFDLGFSIYKRKMNPYSIALIICALTSFFLGVHALQYKHNPIAKAFSGLTLTSTLYILGYGLEIASNQPNTAIFWYHFQYIGIPFIPAFWLILSFYYSNRLTSWRKPICYITLLLSVAFTLLVATNPYHHLYRHNVEFFYVNGLMLSTFDKNIAYWFFQVYLNGSMLIGNLLLFHAIIHSTKKQKVQATIMFTGSVIPWLFVIVYQLGGAPYGIDIITFSLGLASMFYAWGLSKYQLINIEYITYERIFENIESGIAIIDSQGYIRKLNKSVADMLHIQEDEVGIHYSKAFATAPTLVELINSGLSQKAEVTVSKSGENSYYQVSLLPISSSSEVSAFGQIVFFYNITDIKQNELIIKQNELRLKELIATKDKFFSIIAHDLKGPIGGMNTLLEFINSSEYNTTQEQMELYLNQLESVSKNTYNLLENLLTWARIQRGEIELNKEKTNILNVIKDSIRVVSNSAYNKSIAIETNCSPNLEAHIDREMVQLIIRNLLGNAIKYSHKNSTISITAELDAGYITLITKDQGIGMNEQTAASLFRISSKIQSKEGTKGEKGTGLGLLLCKEFAELHNGTIWVDSIPEKGSTFYVKLPA